MITSQKIEELFITTAVRTSNPVILILVTREAKNIIHDTDVSFPICSSFGEVCKI
jgi:hypothetical protein